MSRVLVVLVFATLCLGIMAASSSAQVSPWPNFQRDQSHTGRTNVTGPSTADTLWTRRLDGDALGKNTAPVIGNDGTVLIGTVQGHVYAYSANGQRQWKITLPGVISAPLAVAANGRILVSTENDSCYVLNPTDGQVLWRAFIGFANSGATMVGNHAYLSSNYNGAGFVFNLDLDILWYAGQSGHLWKIDLSSPVISVGGQIAVGTTENLVPFSSSGHISVLDANCQELCSYNLGFFNGRGVRSSLSQTSTGRFVGGSTGDNTSFYGEGGFISSDLTCTGCLSGSGHYFSSPAITSSDVVVIGTSSGLSLRNPANCAQTVLYPTGPILNPSPVIDGAGTIYVGDDNGKLWAWSAAGTNGWNRQLESAATSIAIDGLGNLYIGTTSGRLYCFPGAGSTAVDPANGFRSVDFRLWPNPTRTNTTLQCSLPTPNHVRCAVTDLNGRSIATIFDGELAAGAHQWTWNGRDQLGRPVPAGMYWATIHTHTTRMTKAVVLLP